MTKVKLYFNKEKDLFNIWETCNKPPRFGYDFTKNMDSRLVSFLKGKKFKDCKGELAKRMALVYNSKTLAQIIKAAQLSWNSIEKEYFRRLENITGKKLNIKLIRAYATTASRCPYDLEGKSFMFNIFGNTFQIILTSAHEIMHFHFHKNYWAKVEKQVGKEKTADLKEALTVLLNLEFKDLLINSDRGYPNHEKLREFIKQEWKKNKDFDKLIDSCIDYLKKKD